LGDLIGALVDPRSATGLPQKIMGRFAERRDHHPGWHAIAMPAGSTADFALRTSSDTPWPVPNVNIFMKYMLELSPKFKPTPRDAAQPLSWVDTVFDVLDILYSTAKRITDTYDSRNAIGQGLGFLGENPLIPSYGYPVWLVCRMQEDDSLQALFAPWSTLAKRERFKPFSSTKRFVLAAENRAVVCAENGSVTTDATNTTSSFTIHYLRQQVIVLQAPSGQFVSVDSNGKLRANATCLENAAPFVMEPREIKLKSYRGPYLAVRHFLFLRWLSASAHSSAKAALFSATQAGNEPCRLHLQDDSGFAGFNLSDCVDKNNFALRSFGNHVYSFLTGNGKNLQMRRPFGIVGIGEAGLSVDSLFKMVVVSAVLHTVDGATVWANTVGELCATRDDTADPLVMRFKAS